MLVKTSSFTFEDALTEMNQTQLGDKRRTARLADSARRISQHPGGSLPEKLHDPAAYRATLRLMNNPAVTHRSVLEPHLRATRTRMAAATGTVLILHDTTELDYSKQKTLSSMGQIGNGGGQGYECHNSLAVDASSGDLLGLACQILHDRIDKPKGEGVKESRDRNSRESLLWVNAVKAIGPAPEGRHLIDVCDRGADTFEFLEYERKHNRHFVIRSTHSRALEVESAGDPHLLHDLLRSLEAQLGWTMGVSANNNQTARTAKLQCSWAKVRIKAPHVKKGNHGRESLEVWAIRVWEVDTLPEVKEPMEWILLTDEPIEDAGRARERVGHYEKRPKVEEFHKAQKTGLSIEQLQLQSQAGMQPLIALLSVLAIPLVNARQAACVPEKAKKPATDYFDPLWVMVLSLWRYREEKPLTVREYILALGRLGGHLNRKCDGMPGWITLWRGTMQLHAMVEYERARQTASGGTNPPDFAPGLSTPSSGKL
jgi:Transposase DNA-binding